MNSPARVKERAEEQSSSMTTDQQTVIRMLANDLHRLNYTVMKAVEAGVSVELVRSARHHGGDGNWGDLLPPFIVTHEKRWRSRPSPSLPCSPIWVLAATQCPNARLSVKFDETDLIYHSLYGRISSTDLPGWSCQSGLFLPHAIETRWQPPIQQSES